MSEEHEKFQCPKCGSTHLHVRVEVEAQVIQKDGTQARISLTPGFSHSWSSDSNMQCDDCKHSATVFQFRMKDTDNPTVEVC